MEIARTARLRLREPEPGDAEFLCRLMNQPSWLANIGDRGVPTPADAERYIRTKLEPAYRENGFGMYLAELRDGDVPAGLCGLVRRPVLPHPDLGFALRTEFEGLGLAQEAARAVLRLAHERFGFETLLAIVKPDNARSIRLLERLGFAREGEHRVPGETVDLHRYAVALPKS